MTSLLLRRLVVTVAGVVLVVATGCRSHYVEASVKNESGAVLPLVEVDYPSASFGKQALPAGATFQYRFKVLGAGATKILWTDAGMKEHSVGGPELHEGDEGKMVVTVSGDGAKVDLKLVGR